MKTKQELLIGKASIKGTMLQAHLLWAQRRLGDVERLKKHVGPECAKHLDAGTLSTAWVPFRCLVGIDQAIATAAGGSPERVFRSLGEHSARMNLSGVYKSFVSAEPHRFFTQMGLLHRQFQDFGESRYSETGVASGRITQSGYPEYSPVYCAGAIGYFEGALQMMHAPGRITVRETACQCAGARECSFELSW